MHSSQDYIPLLRGPVPFSHLLLRQFVRKGDRAVDATCGNGKDTLLLAELVGATGHVWAFDIQPEALARTEQRLSDAGLSGQTTLVCQGHEQLAQQIHQPLNAVVFNLGWLPGSDRTVVTRPETTLAALAATLPLLASGGILLVTCYPGHAGGDLESSHVQDWSGSLPANAYHAWRLGQLNVNSTAPFCLLIQKASTQHAV